MGYDIHITRAFLPADSARYPILAAEVERLAAAEPDLSIATDPSGVVWAGPPDGREVLWSRDGRLAAKNPSRGLLRRMTELAERLDAWVVGDDGELHEWTGAELVERQRGPAAFDWQARFLTRGTSCPGLNGHAPIRRDEWTVLVAEQPDFATMTRVEATLPSGVRWIDCPPVACWTGHPAGRPVPFFFADDLVEVRHADDPTVRRMTALAAILGARVLDGDDRPVG